MQVAKTMRIISAIRVLRDTGDISDTDFNEATAAIKSLPHSSPAGKKSGAGTVKAAGQKQLTV